MKQSFDSIWHIQKQKNHQEAFVCYRSSIGDAFSRARLWENVLVDREG